MPVNKYIYIFLFSLEIEGESFLLSFSDIIACTESVLDIVN